MSQKIIGILATQSNNAEGYKGITIGIEEQYAKLFSQYGKVVCIMPNTLPSDYAKIDLLVLQGGADLDTSFTSDGKDLVVGNGPSNPMYSQFYKHFLNKWIDAGVPIFGICLGAQALNVCLGGGLTPDGPNHSLAGLHPIAVYNEQLGLYTVNDSKFLKIKRPFSTEVNSRHHQFIRPFQLAECLIPIALGVMDDSYLKTQDNINNLWEASSSPSSSPGLLKRFYDRKFTDINKRISHIEAFMHSSKKIAGVQWHPESMWISLSSFTRGCEVSHVIINWLLEDDDNGVKVKVVTNDPPKTKNIATTLQV
jgi:gamma-glutamyl-gamma-aminobutyrate hydrolase PuuD